LQHDLGAENMVWLCFGTTESLKPGKYFGAEAVHRFVLQWLLFPGNIFAPGIILSFLGHSRQYICSPLSPEQAGTVILACTAEVS